MRFSVDAHAIGQHLTGNEVYVRNLLRGFAALDQTSEFIAYVAEQEESALAIPRSFPRRQVSRNCFVRLGWDLTRRVREDRPDLLHVQYTAPLVCSVPVVVSVHDVSFLEHPEYFPFWRTLQLRTTVKRTVQSAARIITPSAFSQQRIVEAYNVDPSKVAVIPIAVSSAFRPLAREAAQAKVSGRFQLPAPFLLNVGDLQPRKNQIGLIKAFEQLIRNHPELPHHLAIVGQETWFSSHVMQAARESAVASRIHFTGFVNDAELLQLYNACELFAFPSLYEGFGLPILEAMACGRAVACSNAAAMPEVANASSLLFDPESTEEMTRAIRDLVLDPALRSRMERLGLQRASLYSWEKTAQKTLQVYYSVAEANGALKESGKKAVTVR